MRRLLWTAGALFPILLALVGNLATNSVKIPPSWSLWVWLGTIALGLFVAAQTYNQFAAGATVDTSGVQRRVELPVGTGGSRPPGTVLDGGRNRRRRIDRYLWMISAFMVLFFLMSLLPGPGAGKGVFSAAEGDPSLYDTYPWYVGLGLPAAFLLLAITAFILKGCRRRTLEFTGEDVTFTKGRRTPIIVPWNDITNMEVRFYWGSGEWLIAFPRAGSLLLTTEPTMSAFRPNSGTIRICNLSEAGLAKHAVEAAIQQWRP